MNSWWTWAQSEKCKLIIVLQCLKCSCVQTRQRRRRTKRRRDSPISMEIISLYSMYTMHSNRVRQTPLYLAFYTLNYRKLVIFCNLDTWVSRELLVSEKRGRFDLIGSLNLKIIQIFITDQEDPQWCYTNFVNYRTLKNADNVRQQLARIMDKYNLRRVSQGGGDMMTSVVLVFVRLNYHSLVFIWILWCI